MPGGMRRVRAPVHELSFAPLPSLHVLSRAEHVFEGTPTQAFVKSTYSVEVRGQALLAACAGWAFCRMTPRQRGASWLGRVQVHRQKCVLEQWLKGELGKRCSLLTRWLPILPCSVRAERVVSSLQSHQRLHESSPSLSLTHRHLTLNALASTKWPRSARQGKPRAASSVSPFVL